MSGADQYDESITQDTRRIPITIDDSTARQSVPNPPSYGHKIAVLIPCYNEEASIEKVVRSFRTTLPNAAIYVCDNNSTDRTAEIARREGAVVSTESQRGKGNVVRRLFADIEVDIYVLVDGDDTYDAASAPALIERLISGSLDMVNAARVTDSKSAYRPGHRIGNALLTNLMALIFGKQFKDMLSGYRVLSRRFVKSFPALAHEFEVETELTVHALELRMPTAEVNTPYKARPVGSTSKLRTFRDGFSILFTLLTLVKNERPLRFFSTLAFLLGTTSIILIWPIVMTFMETGLVPRLPTAILATGMMIVAFIGVSSGLILETVTLGRREMKRMRYLSIPAVQTPPSGGSAGN